jgi:hypothetical protein
VKGTQTVQTLHIIASCAQGKRCAAPPDLRLGSIPDGPLTERLAAWKVRLRQSKSDAFAAADLYRGQYWSVVRDLPTVAKEAGFRANLWVASAGYGLIPAEAQVHSYSATFIASEEDGVWRPGDGDRRTAFRIWWNGLQARPNGAVSPSLTSIACEVPDTTILVIASPAYILAMADDLAGARKQLNDSQRLLIVSSRHGSLPPWLTPHIVPSEAPLSGVLGGALGSLHARTARRILQESSEEPLRADVLVPYYEHLISEVESATVPARLKLRDEDIRRFIREITSGTRVPTCTAALRKLRMTGQACEQRRFAGLYAEVTRRADVA